MSGRLRRGLFWLTLAAGVVGVAQAAYIPLKGWLAQELLEAAWERRRADGVAARPWPWADTTPVARLRQTRLDVDQIVLAGASGRVLAFGPGHVTGSAYPGRAGNVVLSAHRDTHFRWLRALQPGEGLSLEDVDGGLRHYRVADLAIRHERDVNLLEPDAGDRLTLITCYPFDALDPGTERRYVVTAVPVMP